ncbi:MAG: PDZ domain-containing protein [Deltaproteobacteria bacterium]|nr:MAG: PDZ domain-containing protein [Deltaproteobacteria bacterium]
MTLRRALPLAAALALVAAAPAWGEAGQARPTAPGRARAGLHVQSMTPELRDYFGAPRDRGILVTRVQSNGPAAAAGVRVGDVLIAVDGEPLAEPHALVRAVGRAPAGAAIELELVRDKRTQRVSVKLAGEPGPWWHAEDLDSMRERFERWLPPDAQRLEELERRVRELEQRFREYLESS